eukprot:s156_g11.t1
MWFVERTSQGRKDPSKLPEKLLALQVFPTPGPCLNDRRCGWLIRRYLVNLVFLTDVGHLEKAVVFVMILPTVPQRATFTATGLQMPRLKPQKHIGTTRLLGIFQGLHEADQHQHRKPRAAELLQVMDLQPRDGSEHKVFVRNTFLEVQDEDEVNEKNALKRSNSWSASSSSSMSSAEDFVHTLQQQAGPGHMTNHFVWNNDSEVSSESAISGSTVPRSSLEDQLRQERMAQVQAKIRELTQNDPMLSGEGDDMPPADIVYSWSAGSANHAAKKCTPCIHFTTKAGCKHGDACRFCHLEHTEDSKRGRHRPCKATRNQCKHLLSQMNDLYKDDPEQKRIAYQTLAEQSPYMKSLLKGVLDPEEASALDAPRRPGLQQDGRAKPSEGSGKSKKKNLISL